MGAGPTLVISGTSWVAVDGDHTYADLDCFARIVQQRWQNDSSANKDSFKYGYERGGNRLDTYQSYTLDMLGNWGTFDDNGTRITALHRVRQVTQLRLAKLPVA